MREINKDNFTGEKMKPKRTNFKGMLKATP